MDIEGTLSELGPVDSAPLIEAVLSQDEEAWKANQFRQQAYDVHYQTESLVMIFCDGWPELEVTREAAWDALEETATPLMQGILDQFYPPGGTIIRAMAAKLKADAAKIAVKGTRGEPDRGRDAPPLATASGEPITYGPSTPAASTGEWVRIPTPGASPGPARGGAPPPVLPLATEDLDDAMHTPHRSRRSDVSPSIRNQMSNRSNRILRTTPGTHHGAEHYRIDSQPRTEDTVPSKRQVSETPETKRAKGPNEGLKERLALFESEAIQAAAERDETQRLANAVVASIRYEEQRVAHQAEARVSVLASEMNADSARKDS